MTKRVLIHEIGVNCSLKEKCGLISAKVINPQLERICHGVHQCEIRHSLYKYTYTFQTLRPEMFITPTEETGGN